MRDLLEQAVDHALMQVTGAVLEEVGRPGPYAESRPLTVGTLDLAAPAAGEVLVRIEAAGVCHSDLSVVDGNRVAPGADAARARGRRVASRRSAPASPTSRSGQRVVMTFLPRCGECAGCATGGRMPCGPGSASNDAGELLGGGRRLSRDGDPVHHHLGVSAFATPRGRGHPVGGRRRRRRAACASPPCSGARCSPAVAPCSTPHRRSRAVGAWWSASGGVGMAALLTAVALGPATWSPSTALAAKRDQALELGATRAIGPDELADAGARHQRADVGRSRRAGNARAFEAALGRHRSR